MQWLSNRFYVSFCWCACIVTFAVPRCAGGFQFGKGQSGISGRVFDEQTHRTLTQVEITLRSAGGVMQANPADLTSTMSPTALTRLKQGWPALSLPARQSTWVTAKRKA
jgi:hypothetical protein